MFGGVILEQSCVNKEQCQGRDPSFNKESIISHVDVFRPEGNLTHHFWHTAPCVGPQRSGVSSCKPLTFFQVLKHLTF